MNKRFWLSAICAAVSLLQIVVSIHAQSGGAAPLAQPSFHLV